MCGAEHVGWRIGRKTPDAGKATAVRWVPGRCGRGLKPKPGGSIDASGRTIARENPLLQGIIDRVDFNATTHGQRDLDDDRLSNLIEAISTKRLGLDDVEADIIGKSYEYLIRKFAEGGGQSAGEFYTPPEVGTILSRVLQPEPGMEIYDPTCGSGGLLIKCEIAMEERINSLYSSPSPPSGERAGVRGHSVKYAPLKLYGQEYIADTWAMPSVEDPRNPRFNSHESNPDHF